MDEQGLLPLQQVHGEEEAPARYDRATIVWQVTQDSTFVRLVWAGKADVRLRLLSAGPTGRASARRTAAEAEEAGSAANSTLILL